PVADDALLGHRQGTMGARTRVRALAERQPVPLHSGAPTGLTPCLAAAGIDVERLGSPGACIHEPQDREAPAGLVPGGRPPARRVLERLARGVWPQRWGGAERALPATGGVRPITRARHEP